MNKLINANLGGRSFAIDEDAYLRLKSYLEAIREKFRGEKFVDEVVTDIETHAAESFAVQYGAGHIISMRDVEELIARVGKAEDLVGDATAGKSYPSGSGANSSSGSENKSSSEASGKKTRRLYRNPDDMVVAGVASGIAAYFGIDPVIVRLIFILITFFGGGGILIYLILWLIVPLAENPSEKLEMRGEPVTLENVEALVKEKFAQARVEETLRRTTEAARPTLHRLGGFFKSMISTIGGALSVVFMAFFVAIAVFICFVMVQIVLGLLGYGMWHNWNL